MWVKREGLRSPGWLSRGVASCVRGGGSSRGLFGCRVLSSGLPSVSSLAGRQPEAFAVHFQDVDMVREPIEQRAGEPFRTEDRGPLTSTFRRPLFELTGSASRRMAQNV